MTQKVHPSWSIAPSLKFQKSSDSGKYTTSKFSTAPNFRGVHTMSNAYFYSFTWHLKYSKHAQKWCLELY